jgi:hypothetical protein
VKAPEYFVFQEQEAAWGMLRNDLGRVGEAFHGREKESLQQSTAGIQPGLDWFGSRKQRLHDTHSAPGSPGFPSYRITPFHPHSAAFFLLLLQTR